MSVCVPVVSVPQLGIIVMHSGKLFCHCASRVCVLASVSVSVLSMAEIRD